MFNFLQTDYLQLSSAEGGDSDLNWLDQPYPQRGRDSGSSIPPGDPNRNRRLGIIITIGVLLIICCSVVGLALYRASFILNPSLELRKTATTGGLVTCQELIDRAMQASGDSCDKIGSNQVCYGNNTLTTELNSGGSTQFARVGDVVSVAELKRLAASPLSLASKEWGIAVFKVMANLPRSLPGETITMVVFGNTTLDNPSNNMQTFYFSSTLGQIECDQVPFDGLMITMPDGAGVSLVINGAEMTLMGNASIKATKNGSMEVSLYSGSGYISTNGESQFVTAGQSTSMDLGGPNGTSATSPPSAPVPLSPEELALACTMTGHFCSSQEITPVSPQEAVSTLLAQLGVTPNPTLTSNLLPSATASMTPSNTITPSKTATPSPTRTTTRTGTPTRTGTSTRTSTPTRTGTTTSTGTITSTSLTGTATFTRTNTPTSTVTSTPTRTLTGTPTATFTATSTNTATLTITDTPSNTPATTSTNTLIPTATTNPCSQITLSNFSPTSDQLTMNISNSTGANISIQTIDANWDNVTAPSQKIQEIRLAGTIINSTNQTNPPVTISSWTSSTTIGNGQNPQLLIQYSDAIIAGTSITVHFNSGCQVQGSN